MNVTIVLIPSLPANPDDLVFDLSEVPISTAVAGVRARWQNAAPRPAGMVAPWGDLQARDVPLAAPYVSAEPQQPPLHVEWSDQPKRSHEVAAPWTGTARSFRPPVMLPWGDVLAKRGFAVVPWGELLAQKERPVLLPWGTPPARTKPLEAPWTGRLGLARDLIAVWGDGVPLSRPELIRWGQGQISAPPITIPIGTDPTNPPLPPVPVQTVYYVNNTATLLRLPDLTPVEALSGSLTFDWGSWAWTLQAVLCRPSDLEVLEPDGSGIAQLVRITLNGWPWTFRIESFTDAPTFGKQAIQVNGRSVSCELAAPYALPRTFSYDDDLNAQQIALAELEDTGWTLDWQLVDWLVPASTFSYSQKTPMDVISQIAAAAGGTVQSDPNNKQLIVLPRYPVSPSDFATATPDLVLPMNILTARPLSFTPNPAYNRVFVAGQANGINARVTRTGTAGDLPADPVVDSLICDIAAATARGKYILDSSGNKSTVGLKMPLFPSTMSPGLMRGGQLAQVNASTPWRAVVTAIRIDFGRPTIWQTATVERSYL